MRPRGKARRVVRTGRLARPQLGWPVGPCQNGQLPGFGASTRVGAPAGKM